MTICLLLTIIHLFSSFFLILDRESYFSLLNWFIMLTKLNMSNDIMVVNKRLGTNINVHLIKMSYEVC